MSWGKAIVVVFVAFALFIGTLVTICVRQDISLVSRNYYQDELRYQDEIDQMNNVAALAERPLIAVREGQLEIRYTDLSKVEHGKLTLVRPSDARYDAVFTVAQTTQPFQRYDISGLPSGRYNARLVWSINGKDFLVQYPIDL